MHEMDVQVIEGRLVVEEACDLLSRNIESLLDCCKTLVTDRPQKGQVSRSQVSDRAQIFLSWNSKTVKGCDVTLVKLIVFLQEEVGILVDSELDFFLAVENRVEPLAVAHVHLIDKERLDYALVNLTGLNNHHSLLTSVLPDNKVVGRVDYIALNLSELSGQIEPALAPFVVVEVLLKVLVSATTTLASSIRK